jgi:hypothetical protein
MPRLKSMVSLKLKSYHMKRKVINCTSTRGKRKKQSKSIQVNNKTFSKFNSPFLNFLHARKCNNCGCDGERRDSMSDQSSEWLFMNFIF